MVGWDKELPYGKMVVFKHNGNILRFFHLHNIAGYQFHVSPTTLRHMTALNLSVVK